MKCIVVLCTPFKLIRLYLTCVQSSSGYKNHPSTLSVICYNRSNLLK